MQRVLVIGCSGAGKSWLSLELGALSGLPVIHLDAHFWQPGWVEPAKNEWMAQVEALATQPCWIMDGNYGGSLAQRVVRADTVILLDYPTWLCLWRVIKRTFANWRHTRPDLAPGCVERFDWDFIRYVLSYRREHRPRVFEKLKTYAGAVVTLASPRQTERYLASLKP